MLKNIILIRKLSEIKSERKKKKLLLFNLTWLTKIIFFHGWHTANYTDLKFLKLSIPQVLELLFKLIVDVNKIKQFLAFVIDWMGNRMWNPLNLICKISQIKWRSLLLGINGPAEQALSLFDFSDRGKCPPQNKCRQRSLVGSQPFRPE